MLNRIAHIFIFALLSLSACIKEESIEKVVRYDGPFVELDNVETLYSDSSVIRLKLQAPKQMEMQNGDRDFPNGLYIEFFDEKGKKSSTLKSNKGKYNKADNEYTVTGNVIIHNLVEKKNLKTEELHWYPEKAKVHTDKFIRIEGPEEILTGNGLDATQDFSSYTILNPVGVFPVEQ